MPIGRVDARLVRLACVVVLLGGCATGPRGESVPAEELLRRAERQLEQHKFRNAEAGFREFLDRHPTDAAADRAQLGLARSLLGVKEWASARTEVTTFLERYPDSPLVETARYVMGVAYARESLPPEMDQELTHKALEEFEAYLADFPRGEHRAAAEAERAALREKLAKKDLLNGQLYLRLGFPEAAHVYFENVLTQYGDSPQVGPARFGLAEVLRTEGKTAEAEALYRELRDSAPDRRLRRECERRLEELARERGARSPG